MSIQFEVTRPDDLLRLAFQYDNVKLDTSQPDFPALVIDNPQLPAFLIVTFPPQSIAETAFFEASIVPPETKTPDPDPDKGSTVIETPPLPGGVLPSTR